MKGSYASSGILPTFAQPPAGAEEFVVACIDVAAGADLASAAAVYERSPTPGTWKAASKSSFTYSAEGTRDDFIADLRAQLDKGRLVALGFEAPLWGTWETPPCADRLLPAFSARPGIDATKRPWYGNAVASEVGPLTVGVLRALGRGVTSGLSGTPWHAACPILVWEAYITEARCCVGTTRVEPSQHRQDACCGVVHGFVNQPQPQPSTRSTISSSIPPNQIIPSLEWALYVNGLTAVNGIGAPGVIKPTPPGPTPTFAAQLWP